MATRLSAETELAVRARIGYFRDLGVFDFYRRGSAPAEIETISVTEEYSAAAPSALETTLKPTTTSALLEPKTPAAPGDRAAALAAIRDDLGPCTRCALHKGRHNIVFGDGDANARLMFIGEGPGADEDAQGLPFVGRAGQLLNNMINAMGLRRDQVYIANIVKCRPPENRQPEKDETATCSPFLVRQIDAIAPKVIVCLGSTAAQFVLATPQSISRFRGEWFDYRSARVIATYHPAYLLRNPNAKGDVWKDLQKVMAVLGLDPKPKQQSAAAR